MYLGLNELSIHGQFAAPQLPGLLHTLLKLRGATQRFGGELRCRRELLERKAQGSVLLRDALFCAPIHESLRRAFLVWLTKEGPFLEADRVHDSTVWYEYAGELVTDTTLAELAHRCLESDTAQVAAVSVSPSTMEADPLRVIRALSDDERKTAEVRNHTTEPALVDWLKTCERPVRSWKELLMRAKRECPNIFFANNAIDPMRSQPFQLGVAHGVLERLRVLDRLKRCFSDNGALTTEGKELRQQHFTGDKAWFSDSSDGEKNDFQSELTFDHPERLGEKLFCPWHGKVKTPQIRIHYGDPITATEPLYVVYIGPKITKR